MKRILIVCTAGICRSPMVMGLLRRRLEEAGLGEQVDIQTAGVFAENGRPASYYSVELLAERGIDIGEHTARRLERQDIDRADLILVMEEEQRRSIFYRAPASLGKVFLLSEHAGEHTDLEDPYGKGRFAYAATLAEIDRLLDAGWEKLIARIGLSR